MNGREFEVEEAKNRDAEPNDARIVSVGIDGSRGGWVAVGIVGEWFEVGRYETIDAICARYDTADVILIDMPIGLPQNAQEANDRPENVLRRKLGAKARSVFSVPFRQQVYARSREHAWELNRQLYAKQTPMSLALCLAIRQVDVFLQHNCTWKNRLNESHPEYAFQVLQGNKPLIYNKRTAEGFNERKNILSAYFSRVDEVVQAYRTLYKVRNKIDDVMDALCLAVMGQEGLQHGFVTIPEVPATDVTGLRMQIVTSVPFF